MDFLRTSRLTNAMEGLKAKFSGKVKVYEWESKAIIHKKLQTVQLIHDSDIKHLEVWEGVYEIADVIIKRV